MFEIAFTITDAAGAMYRHVNLLSWQHLWPGEGADVEIASCHFSPVHARIRGRFDLLDLRPVGCWPEDAFERLSHSCESEFIMREQSDGIAVRLTAASCEQSELRSNDASFSIDYVVPLDQLLWKRSPTYLDDDIIVESADYVDFEMIELPLPVRSAIHGLAPSPVRKIG